MNPVGLHIVAIGTGIANMGVGQGNDLSAIGWVGQNFLITRHCRIEDHLADSLAFGPDRGAMKDCAIL